MLWYAIKANAGPFLVALVIVAIMAAVAWLVIR
jgi:hypothetical protein